MPHLVKILAALVTSAVLLAGCGGSGTGREEPGLQDRSGPVTVDIKVSDGEVTPAGERFNAKVGQPIKLKATSDQPDEIHVHSEPEHEFEVQPGKSQTFRFKINRPGVYEVESHKTDTLIFSLAVRP